MFEGFAHSFLAAANESAAAASEALEEGGGIAKSFEEGGIWMWPILIVGLVVLAITVDRIIVLFFKTTSRREQFLSTMRQHIMSRNLDKAVQFASHDTSPLGRIVKAGLVKVNHEDEVVQSAMDEAALAEIPALEKRTGFLPMLSNVATLMGLLGTIIGLIGSFAAVSAADAATKATLLSKGISEAMNCTAFGLIVAIPALLFYAALQARTQRCIDDINAAAVNIVNLVIVNRDKLGLTVRKEG
jgi:biopolymer transport protein ExbB/TolQ